MALLVVLIGNAIAPPIALAQMPSLTVPSVSQPLPVGVERRGTLESTGIHLDGQELFRIASPAVFNRNELTGQIPVEVRATQVEANLQRLIPDSRSNAATLDPATLEVLIRNVNGYPVLFVKDATLAEMRVLLTVTDADAQYHSLGKESLADQWRDILEQELRQAIELRLPEARQQQTATVIKVLTSTGLLTLLLGASWAFLGQRERRLEQRQVAESALLQAQKIASREPADEELGLGLLQGLYQHLGLQRRLQIVRLLRWLLFWSIAFVWATGFASSLHTFPQTRQLARQFVVVPIVLLTSWFLIGLINRLVDLIVARFIQNLAQDQSLTPANFQRITTIARVIKGLKMVLIYAIGVLWVLQWLNLIPGSILALGTVIALLVSFAAQSLVRDLVNGFLILLEDQFRIGDFVRVGSVAGLTEISGSVESLNLRITQIRSVEGGLITLPNSSIAQVENMSRTWARADFHIEVAYDTDIDQALAIVRETVDQMEQDPEWRSMILDTHELFGVEQLSHTGIVIRVWVKTAPLKQWIVARELRRRLKVAFDCKNIQIGVPQQIWLQNGSGKPH
ncbi:MAG: mechanosensitive ion channel family protein [Elainellaceae cyanobacterium]